MKRIRFRRRWLFWLLMIGFVWVVVSRYTEIEVLYNTLRQGRLPWVLAAALLQMAYYAVFTALYQAAFFTVEVKSRLRELLPLMFASVFVNVAAPTAGASAMALFMDDSARRGESPTRTAAGIVLVLVTEFSAFMPILALGLAYLFIQHDLEVYQIIGAAIMVLLITGLTGVLLIGLWRPGLLRALLRWTKGVVNHVGGWVKRPDLLSTDWPEATTVEFTEAANAIVAHPRRLLRTAAIALGLHSVDLLSLYTLFRAFSEPISFGGLVAGYAMGFLFWIVSPTPQGVGVVEGVMALVYGSLGVELERATVIALAFRGLTFWLPFGVGFLLLRRLKTFGHRA
jgi:hypothetical protein